MNGIIVLYLVFYIIAALELVALLLVKRDNEHYMRVKRPEDDRP